MTFYQYFQQQILMKKNLLLFFVCQTLSLGFLFGQIPAQNKSLKNFGTFTMRISGKMQIIQVDEEENLYLLIHKKDTLIFFNNAKVYSQAEIYLFPGREEIDKTTKIDKSSWRYNELKDVRKIRIRKRRKSFAIIDLGAKHPDTPCIPLEITYYSETSDKLFISAVCKTCDEGYRCISKPFSRKIIRALNSVKFKNDQ